MENMLRRLTLAQAAVTADAAGTGRIIGTPIAGAAGGDEFGNESTSFSLGGWPEAPPVLEVAHEMGITHRFPAESDLGHVGFTDKAFDRLDQVDMGRRFVRFGRGLRHV